ncbi:MAG: PEP-CTERM sorting domain-containing protein [Planctomycetes bacterium]|nr:PEP-CTERM sorting domain-containing protein [Planctomycetota bacterium]
MKKYCLFAMIMCVSATAWSSIITFDAEYVYSQRAVTHNDYYEGDYRISGTGIIFNPFNQNPYAATIPNNGTQHLGDGYYGELIIERIDKGPFDVYCLDVARYSSVTSGDTFWYDAIKTDGEIVRGDLPLDDLLFDTHVIDLKDITYLEFYCIDTGSFAVDNIIVVPEPATLLLLGLGSLVIIKRKFKA